MGCGMWGWDTIGSCGQGVGLRSKNVLVSAHKNIHSDGRTLQQQTSFLVGQLDGFCRGIRGGSAGDPLGIPGGSACVSGDPPCFRKRLAYVLGGSVRDHWGLL